jgi:plastocyanin domain-containing protein
MFAVMKQGIVPCLLLVAVVALGMGCNRNVGIVVVDKRGFTPSSITVDKGGIGSTATVTFKRTTDDTCARWVVIPDLQRNIPLPLDKPVAVRVPTERSRALSFECGAGMFRGSVVIE